MHAPVNQPPNDIRNIRVNTTTRASYMPCLVCLPLLYLRLSTTKSKMKVSMVSITKMSIVDTYSLGPNTPILLWGTYFTKIDIPRLPPTSQARKRTIVKPIFYFQWRLSWRKTPRVTARLKCAPLTQSVRKIAMKTDMGAMYTRSGTVVSPAPTWRSKVPSASQINTKMANLGGLR